MSQKENLPPLPGQVILSYHIDTGVRVYGYTAEDMREYAGAAWDAGREHGRGDTVVNASSWIPIDSLAQHGSWVIVTDGVEWSVAKWYADCWRNLHGQRLEPPPTRYLPVPPLPEVKP